MVCVCAATVTMVCGRIVEANWSLRGSISTSSLKFKIVPACQSRRGMRGGGTQRREDLDEE